MLSKMAMEDLRQLEEDGVSLDWRDAVRLNDLGLRVEEQSLKCGCPVRRMARIGRHLFEEMTIAQSAEFQRGLRILSLSEFSEKATELAAIAALRFWFSEVSDGPRLATVDSLDRALGLLSEVAQVATLDELFMCLRWLNRVERQDEVRPTDEARPVDGKEADEKDADGSDVLLGLSLNGSIVVEASVSEVGRLSVSQLLWAVRQKREMQEAGQSPHPVADNAAFVEYARLLEEIRHGKN